MLLKLVWLLLLLVAAGGGAFENSNGEAPVLQQRNGRGHRGKSQIVYLSSAATCGRSQAIPVGLPMGWAVIVVGIIILLLTAAGGSKPHVSSEKQASYKGLCLQTFLLPGRLDRLVLHS